MAIGRDDSAAIRPSIGSAVIINGVAFTIAGVTPSQLGDLTNRGSFEGPDYAMPFSAEPEVLGATRSSTMDPAGGSSSWAA